MDVVVNATTTPNTEVNVMADSPRGDRDRTIVVGAHLDGVEAGPGIHDNGSGRSGILEIAEEIAELRRERPNNRLRFAFWGAEEAGLVDSTAYVAEQRQNGGIADIEANLNFDMIGSPNFVRFVYDGTCRTAHRRPAERLRARRRSRRCSCGTSPGRVWRPTRPRSTVARTTVRSSRTGVRPVVCSPAPSSSRRSATSSLRRLRGHAVRSQLSRGR
jgi:Peptidase family M28